MGDDRDMPGPPPLAPAGWYADSVPGRNRYWDGQKWTRHIAPNTAAEAGGPTPHVRIRGNDGVWLVLFATVAALVGSFMPWVAVDFGGLTISASGLDFGAGKLTAIVAAAAGVLVLVGAARHVAAPVYVAMALVVAGFAISLKNFINLQDLVGGSERLGSAVSAELGLYLCFGGFLVALVGLGVVGAQLRAASGTGGT